MCYLPRRRPLLPYWPLPRGSTCSSLLVLRPFGGSVHRMDTPDTLASCLARATARNVQFGRPTSAEKCAGNARLAHFMAVAADKTGVRHLLGHGVQFVSAT
jgi:hypothetical protein